MTSVRWQQAWITLLGAAVAVWAGWQVAEGSYGGPALLAMAAAFILLAKCGVRPETALTGVAVFGYILGNRGFAQLMPFSGLPLFVAELALGGTLALLAVRGALARRLPVQRDALNLAVAAWLVIGGARLVIDLRAQGWWALRDAAVIYYALYFFAGQELGSDPIARRQLLGILKWALVLLAPVFMLSLVFPLFFQNRLLVQGVPVFFYKADLVATMLAGGVFWFADKAGRRGPQPLPRRAGLWLVLAVTTAGALFPVSRAAMAGLAGAAGWQVVGRRWRALGTLVALLVALATAGLAIELIMGRPLEQTAVYRVGEYAFSVFDLKGTGNYQSYEEASDTKGRPDDNNRFRLVWWRTVAKETWREHPMFGAGFGYDLANGFVEEYGLSSDLDFNARSPHSIVFTMFGRMGFVGLGLLAGLGIVLVMRTWAAARRDGEELPLWCFGWVILISACFGVVLEGPMGAVVFWTVLGLANASLSAKPATAGEEPAAENEAEALHAVAEKV